MHGPWKPEHELKLQILWASLCECWELKSGSPQQQYMIWITKPSLQLSPSPFLMKPPFLGQEATLAVDSWVGNFSQTEPPQAST